MTRSPETVPFPEDPRDPEEGGGWTDFLSESEELQSTAAAPAVALDNTIGLDEIVARQVPVPWADAVAIVEELCQVLVEAPGPSGIPEAADVSITAEGRVVVDREARRDGDLSRIGVILQTLLPVTSTSLQP